MANIRAAENTSVFAKPMMVLRKVDFEALGEEIVAMLAMTQLEPKVYEGEFPYFSDQYIANDHPRSTEVSDALIAATVGFGVARTDTGEVVRTFDADGLVAAINAAASARVTLQVDAGADEEKDRRIAELEAKLAELEAEATAEAQAREAAQIDEASAQ